MDGTEAEIRIGRTQALFRSVNERIVETAEFESDETEIVCECPDRDCTERLEVPLAEYEEVRADATRFLVAPGHEEPEVGRVVERRPGYEIVQKVNRAVASVVRRLDPRSNRT